MKKKNPLFDINFLNELYSKNEREIYARITLLSFDEKPIESLEGKITDGSINIDSSSAVRRTCNLNMVAENVNINEFYWGLKSKFKLEVGLKNEINFTYPDIIWFKQGIFVLTQFNTTQTTNKWTIKIQGKDKMCLLNGDIAGSLPFNVDFGEEEFLDLATDKVTYTKIPIKTIIKKAVVEYGKELLHNIVINDIDEAGQELLEYRGIEPLYLFKDLQSEDFKQMTVKKDFICYYRLKKELTFEQYNNIPKEYNFLLSIYTEGENGIYYFNENIANKNIDYQKYNFDGWFKGKISDSFNIIYDDLLDDQDFEGGPIPTQIRFNLNKAYSDKRYVIAKFEAGDIPGYRMTDLTFAGELIGKAGESLTSVLDKIKNKFTNFEYYYDIDGKFVFQKKKEYITTPWNSVEEEINKLYSDSMINNSQIMFNFMDSKLITSFQNTPKYNNLKNDYVVWGERDKNIPIHMRYAIDVKPIEYLPIRPLKERIHTVIRDSAGKLIDEYSQYKYYDAPEIEPYNENCLLRSDYSCTIIDLIEKQYDKDNLFNRDVVNKINAFINSLKIPYSTQQKWINLFQKVEGHTFKFMGNKNDIIEMINTINKSYIFYENEIKTSVIPNELEGKTIITIFPYYAKYPYKIESYTVLSQEEIENLELTKEDLNNYIRYKVDWRELIYQMALDYRKLNYTDNYLYFLTKMNNFVKNGKTGYEQYYTDLLEFWRQLYNPNSKILLKDISISDLQKYRNFIINNSEDKVTDLIYISHGYENIKDDKYEDLDYLNLYKYSKPFDAEKSFIQSYINSDACHLNFQENYYIENKSESNKGTMSNYLSEEKEDAGYTTLNSTDIDKIYLKNDELFNTIAYEFYNVYNVYGYKVGNADWSREDIDFYIFQNNEYIKVERRYESSGAHLIDYNKDYFVKERKNGIETYVKIYPTDKMYLYEPCKYYYFENDSYILADNKIFNPNLEYFYINYKTNFEVFESKITSNNTSTHPFKVLIHPRVSNLNTFTSDYISFLLENFKKTKEELKNENNKKYYFTKSDSEVRLSDLKDNSILWNLYYNNFIYSLCNQTSDVIKNLIDNEEKNKDNLIKYLNSIQDILQKYFIYLSNLNYNEKDENIIINIYQCLYDLIINYYTVIQDICDWYIDEKNISNINSCLPYLINNLKIQLNKITIENYPSMENLLQLLKYFYNINLSIQNTLNLIDKNYNQVKILIENNDKIQSSDKISDIIFEINTIKKLLADNKDNYIEGQLEKTEFMLNELLINYSNYTDDKINEVKNFYQEIVNEIEKLPNFLINLKTIILKSENNVILDYNISLFNYEKEKSYYKIFINLLSQIVQLEKVFDNTTIQNDLKNNLNKLLVFQNKYIFFEELYNFINISKHDNQDILTFIENYDNSRKYFQEFIPSYNINNFNYLKNNQLIYEPIKYKLGYYNFNKDPINGNYWTQEVYNNPQLLLFWLDFLEPTFADIAKYSIPTIGDRVKTVNDKDVKAVHYKEIPSIIFKNPTQEEYEQLSGYTYINITDAFMNLFAVSSKGKTAKERIDELLYNHSYCTENVNIQTVPIYTLEPNHKIYIKDEKSKIDGEYLVNKITVPLGYKKMMSITGIKSVTDIK